MNQLYDEELSCIVITERVVVNTKILDNHPELTDKKIQFIQEIDIISNEYGRVLHSFIK